MAYTISSDCIACGTCEAQCPVSAISTGQPYKISGDACIECGACESQCPVSAISKK
ncbi:hypothetical protein AGMMS49975_04540 [Clostridia bacterium]|nr:hypothetical protein AGMMS49975_04540 [Clostridia bacterium]